MPAKNTKKQPDPDWEAVARDYVAGVLTIKQICEKYSNVKKNIKLNKSRLYYQMQLRGYKEARLLVREKLKNDPVGDLETINVSAEKVANEYREYARKHVKGLSELQDMFVIMMENMNRALKSVDSSNGDTSKIISPAFLGRNETIADYLKKMTDMYVKAIQMERACLGLDKDKPDDDEKTYEDRLQELHEEQPELPDNSNVIDGEFTEIKSKK